jgi:hypothetical protein
MTLQSSEQKKKFIADGTSINKKASVGTFYAEKKTNSKTFSKKGEFSTRQLIRSLSTAIAAHLKTHRSKRWAILASLIQRKRRAVLVMRLNPTKKLPVAHTQRTGLFWIRVKAKSRLTGRTAAHD